MKQAEIITSVSKEVEWWVTERRKKFDELRHESMAVNPFLLPLIFGIHSFRNFDELAEFLVAAHLATGHATGFGKLIDEKILPKVFGTTKLDAKTRKKHPFSLAAFDEIDHVVHFPSEDSVKLLSLKAGRWTIQLTMAVQLNRAFNELLKLRRGKKLGMFTFDEIAVGVFYGTKGLLTDKYDILRGVNRGANHEVKNLTKYVHIYAGQKFWAWLNSGEMDTQEWVLKGVVQGFDIAERKLGKLNKLIVSFRNEFSKQFRDYLRPNGSIDWAGITRKINNE